MRSSRQRRPLLKQGAVIESLRNQIVSGELKPESRMPTRDELEKRFGVSRMTLQRVFDRLARDGFIVSRGNLGTFVSGRPPHLSSYALVFHSKPGDPDWSRFWTALGNEAVTLERARSIKIQCYYAVDGNTDCEDYQRLLHDVQAKRLAGLIFSSLPGGLLNTPLIHEGGTPCVALMLPLAGCRVPAVYPDLHSFVDRALDALLARGRRRVAVVSNSGWWAPMGEYFMAAVKARDMECFPYWAQMVEAANSRRLVHLLMNSQQLVRPNGLIIADDNLVEHGTAGLLAAGVRVPEDVEVVAHCNFPWAVPSVLPVQRLGFDARRILATCLESIDAQRRQQDFPAFVSVPSQFEYEVTAPGPADVLDEGAEPISGW